MKKPLKISLIVLSFIIGLIVLLLAYLLFFFDVNNYKETIESSVFKQTGRELRIKGKMNLSLFPWLGLEVNDLSLGNAEGFIEPHMAHFEKALFKIKLLPLLKKDIHVGTLQLQNFQIHLAKNEQGLNNWQELIQGQKDPSSEKSGSTASEVGAKELAAFSIERIRFLDGTLTWRDQTRNAASKLSDLNLDLGPVQLQTPFPFELSGSLSSNQPRIDRAEFQCSGKTSLDFEKQRLSISELQVNTKARGAGIPGEELELLLSGNVEFDHPKQTVSLKNFKAKAYNLTLEGELSAAHVLKETPELQGRLKVQEFNPKTLLAELQLPPIQTTDPKALSSAAAQTRFQATPKQITLSDLQAAVDGSNLQGKARIGDFKAPRIEFRLKMDQIDIDRYLPPKMTEDQSAGKPKKQPKSTSVGLPMEPLRTLDLDGKVSIDDLTVHKMNLNKVEVQIRAEDGVLRIDPLTAKLYKGTIRNTTRIDVRSETPKVTSNNTINSVFIEPLLDDLFNKKLASGSGGIEAKLDFQGLSSQEILRSLSGNLSLLFENGAVKGVDISGLIRSASALLKGQQPERTEKQSTDFSLFKASADLKNGSIRKSALELLSPLFSVKGQGQVNLLQKALNYDLMVHIPEDISEKHAELANLSGKSIPMTITGSLDNPDYTLDLKSVLQDRLRKEGEKRLGKELDKLKDKLNVKPESDQDGQQTLEPKKLLKDLFN